MPILILLLFFCSGATALVYEVVWSKYLALIFGSTVYAQTVVLAVFMGGLALGNRIFGRRADLLKQPLAAYGYIEMAIGVFAFFFDYLHKLAENVFVSVGTGMLEQEFLQAVPQPEQPRWLAFLRLRAILQLQRVRSRAIQLEQLRLQGLPLPELQQRE